MKITVFGCGYVGLVTAACLAEVGNHVICADVDDVKLEALGRGELPFREPGLPVMVAHNTADGRLAFTGDAEAAVRHGDVLIIAVGTPQDEDGSADLTAVHEVIEAVSRYLDRDVLVVMKSTVPVGTTRAMKERIAREVRGLEVRFASNPEFLKAGAAVKDFMRPDRIVIGVEDAHSENQLRMLYAPFNRNREKIFAMDIASAELTKYAANAILATRISCMNEIAAIAERVGADIEEVRIGIGSDPRIGYHFIYPGAGFGGSCLPKDIRALSHTAAEHGVEAGILRAVDAVNERQKAVLFEKIEEYFQGELTGRTIAVWGLAFKPGTDDLREAPSRVLIEKLWAAGARVRAHDPEAMPALRSLYGERPDLSLHEDPYEALAGADALTLVTEWRLYWSPDFERMRELLHNPVVFDGRNIYDPELLAGMRIHHIAIGRPRRPWQRREP